ncbi:hypothetical protein [Pseudoxanthomonas kalamensis]|uniref:hypothetical protein n=1 Tax=Pseudoxanthomonas kalamensis TaxID=289483 RepID=UPI0013910DAA|nr:hypothetical protein [Pseudoxanthomonas kalamensis]
MDWINPLATVAASFAGAWAAFKLQSTQQKNEEVQKNITAANRTLLTLMQQVNELKLFQIDQLDPYRESPARHIQILPTLPYSTESLKFDFQSLSFFNTKGGFQILFELSVEERRYIEALKAINERSLMMRDSIHPMLIAAGFDEKSLYSKDDYLNALGESLYMQLKRLTNQVYYHVDRTIDSIYEMNERFKTETKKKYPKATLVNFEFASDVQQQKQSDSLKYGDPDQD